MKQEMDRPMTEVEEKRYTDDIPREEISLEQIWNKRPYGFTIKMTTTESQFEFIKSALEQTLNLQGWTVNQRSFISGARSLNEKDSHDNLTYFKVPQSGIESIKVSL
jgi:hypothetical protein